MSQRGFFGLHKEALIFYSEKTDMGLDSYKSSEDNLDLKPTEVCYTARALIEKA